MGFIAQRAQIAGVKLSPKRSHSASDFSKNLRAFTISCIIF
ncbi:hypothetical protein [Helicobacter pylori]|nr:hypothetical protein [Helicobacter pylori]